MEIKADPINPRLQKLVDLGCTGLDIMHGELKNQMLEAEQELLNAQQIEEDNDYSDAMESMDRKYWEGFTEALSMVYNLTYDLSFAIAEKEANNA
jgi:hypothetical protein